MAAPLSPTRRHILEIGLLILVAAAGLPFAAGDYDFQPPPMGVQREAERNAKQIAALLPFGGEVRSSHWQFAEMEPTAVEKTASARKRVDELRRLEVRIAEPLRWHGLTPDTLRAFSRWLLPPGLEYNAVGRPRTLKLYWASEELLTRQSYAFAQRSAAARTAAENDIRPQVESLFGLSLHDASEREMKSSEGLCASGPVDLLKGEFQDRCYTADAAGQICEARITALGPYSLRCVERTKLDEDSVEGGFWSRLQRKPANLSAGFKIAGGILFAFTLAFFGFAALRCLFKAEWDLRSSLRAGLGAGLLVLIAWPFPFEWRPGMIGWPLMALVTFITTAAAFATFLSLVRAESEEAAEPLEAVVTRRLLTRDVLMSLGEGALAALALLGATALLDTLLFHAGWAHWPFLPELLLVESVYSLTPWLHGLRGAALWLAPVIAVIWLNFRLYHWLMPAVAVWAAPLFAGLVLGAMLGAEASLSGVLCVAVGFALFASRRSRGGLLVLLSAAFFWHLAPLALRAPPLGSGGSAALLAAFTFIAVFALAIYGALRAPALASGEVYVPAYISRTREQTRFKRELEIARGVQLRFLPERAPALDCADIAFQCTPAMEVGGDYFDFLPRPGALDMVVGDVSGKGVASAFYMTLAKGILHTLCRLELSPLEVVQRLNAIFHDNSPQGVFITLAYASYDIERRTLTYIRAGHNSCLIRRNDGSLERLMPRGMIVGFDPGPRFEAGLETAAVSLSPGDAVLLYTDGASEAMNGRSDEYGETRLGEAFAAATGDAAAMLAAVERSVVAFCAGERQRDDLTLLVCKIL